MTMMTWIDPSTKGTVLKQDCDSPNRAALSKIEQELSKASHYTPRIQISIGHFSQL